MIVWLSGLLPPELTGEVTALLLGMSFLGSLITVAFGIGGGALLLAVMAVTMPPLALIPIHGVVQLGSNLGRAVIFVRHTFWPALPLFVVGSLIGVAIGGNIAMNIPPWVVQTGVGLFIFWSVLARPPRWLSAWPLLTGLISSFLTMFFGATGVFVANYSKSLNLPRHKHVATHATLMTLQHLLKSLAFGLLGFAFGPWVPFIAAMILVGLLGTFAGSLILTRMTDVRFHRALDIVLLLIAARLIWSGLGAAFYPV
jgi:uncharacterized membrane protein YfcA